MNAPEGPTKEAPQRKWVDRTGSERYPDTTAAKLPGLIRARRLRRAKNKVARASRKVNR